MRKTRIPQLDPTLQRCTQTLATGSPGNELTRRSFLRYAGLGTAGTALLLTTTVDMFAADLLTEGQAPPEAPVMDTGRDGSEMGEVTLDGLMLTYFSVSPAFASSVFTFGKNFSTTFTLKLPKAPGVVLTGSTVTGGPMPAGSHNQHASSWVKDGIILSSAAEAEAKARRFSSREAQDLLQIYGLRKPTLRFSGTADRLLFSMGDMGEASFNLGREVNAETSASMYSQYITDPALLFPPRFYWVDVAGADGETALDFVLPSKLMVRNGITATVTCKIMDQTGFRSRLLREAFAPGNAIEITYHSAQEFYSKNLMELQTTPSESDSRIYIDRVFKTFVMTERPIAA
jgi:hypothetical protein